MNRDEALQCVIKNLKYRGNANNTINMYTYFLSKFFDYVSKEDISTLTVDDCMDYIIYLKELNHYKHSTLNLMIASYRYLFEVVLNKPLTKRQLPSLLIESKDPSVFTVDQLQLLLNKANLKMKAAIVLGFDCGFRVSEVVKLKCSDINSKDMTLRIGNSKRRKTRIVKLSPFTLNILRHYWKAYLPSNEYLFPSSSPCGYMNPASLNNAFRLLLKECDFQEEFSFHSLRHTFATLMLKNDCDIFLLKKLLGHNSFSSTSRYIRMENSDIVASFSISDKIGFSYE